MTCGAAMNHIEANQSETTSCEDKFRAYLRETAGSLYTSLRQFWLGALSNKGGRGQRNREEIGAGALEPK